MECLNNPHPQREPEPAEPRSQRIECDEPWMFGA